MLLNEMNPEAQLMLRVWRGKNEGAFLRAQHAAISRLIPVLYVVVVIATIALSFSYSASAPLWLSVSVPAIILVPIFIRFQYWRSVRAKADTLPIEKIRRDIKHTNVLGPIIALMFTAVGVGILSSSTSAHPEIAGIAIWVLALTSAFCLAALPFASISILLSAAAPLIFSLLSEQEHVAQAMGGVVVLVTAQVAYMLVRNYISFFEIVHSKAELQTRKEEAELAEQKARILANTDHLTGLPNRRSFEQMLFLRQAKAGQNHKRCAVGILDLDGFKPVNDVYGHSAGDEVLVEVAKRLKEQFGTLHQIARLGGDEFAFIAEIEIDLEIADLSDRIHLALGRPYILSLNRSVRIASSIGVAIHSSDQADSLRVIAQADIALYRAKASGKATTIIFSPEMELISLEHSRIEQGLRKAISKGDLDVYFQPIYEISPHRLAGFEALARWTDSELGSISPAVFIPIAEEVGLIGPLTELMLRKAAKVAVSWPEDLYLSFNVSAEQLVRESAGLRIIAQLAECGLAPQRLEIEVTETALMKDISAAQRTIENLKAAGVRLSLDDFGTGYSSLSQICNLPLDRIKIDKTFIDHIVTNEKNRNLVLTIITMCNALQIKCTAEGIETTAQLNALIKAGCHSSQGYLFAKPMPSDDVQKLIEQTYPKAKVNRKAS